MSPHLTMDEAGWLLKNDGRLAAVFSHLPIREHFFILLFAMAHALASGFLPSTPLGFRLHVYHGCILRTTLSFDVHEMLRARSGRGDKSTALPRRQPVELRLMKIFVTRDKERWGGYKASSR